MNNYIYTMTKMTLTLFSMVVLLAFACNTPDSLNPSDAKDQTSKPSSLEKEKPEGLKKLNEAEKRGMRLLKRRNEVAMDASSAKNKNLISPYRYLTTSDDYPIFTKLMLKSNLTKHIHSAKVTLLTPVDKAFEAYPNYKELLLPKNEEQLNNFIAYHIVNTDLEYKQFMEDDSWKVHAGPTLSLTKKGGVNFNGAHVRSGSISTENGSIIGMDDLIFYPNLSD